MKKSILIMLALILIPSYAFSGKIYGVIKEGSKPVKAGIKVEITATEPDSAGKLKSFDSGKTDKYGAYIVYVPNEGEFLFKVSDTSRYHDTISPYRVRSRQKAVRYNFIIEKNKQGMFTMRRE